MAVPYIGGILLDNIENNIGRQHFLPDDPFQFSDRNFIKMYRLRKQDVTNLEEMLQPFIPLRRRQDALSNRVKILSTLRFFAGGSYQLDIGRNHAVTISQPSVSRSLHEVLEALNHPAIVNNYIHYPNTLEQLRILRQSFFENTNIPGLVGIIDCTHINLVTPVVNEHVYVNRKNFHSLNVQMICDEKKKILNVSARFPGSTHDSFVWRNSRVEEFLRTLDDNLMGCFYLLWDSAYPVRPWLITPYLPQPAPGTPEFRFNERMRQIRVLIERTFGELKNRFRCLLKDRVLHYAPITAGKIVTACAIFYNICIENHVSLILDDNEEYVNEIIENFENDLQEERRLVINKCFARGQQIRKFFGKDIFLTK